MISETLTGHNLKMAKAVDLKFEFCQSNEDEVTCKISSDSETLVN